MLDFKEGLAEPHQIPQTLHFLFHVMVLERVRSRVLISWVSTGIHFWCKCHHSRQSSAVQESLNLREVLDPDASSRFSIGETSKTQMQENRQEERLQTFLWRCCSVIQIPFSWMLWRTKKTNFDRLGFSTATVLWDDDDDGDHLSVWSLHLLSIPVFRVLPFPPQPKNMLG